MAVFESFSPALRRELNKVVRPYRYLYRNTTEAMKDRGETLNVLDVHELNLVDESDLREVYSNRNQFYEG
jgi:hypothetical protein